MHRMHNEPGDYEFTGKPPPRKAAPRIRYKYVPRPKIIKPIKRIFTPFRARCPDETFLKHIEDGLSAIQIAEMYSVSVATVSERRRMLLTVHHAAVSVPAVSERFVAKQIDAFEELMRCLGRANKLMDACDEWLTDADDPEKYNLGPRADELDVTYEVAVLRGEKTSVQRRKASLSELMSLVEGGKDRKGDTILCVVDAEFKRADPRELILKTIRQVQGTISTAGDIARMLTEARETQAFHDTVVREINKVDVATGQRIAEAIQRSAVLRAALGEISTVIGGNRDRGEEIPSA